MPRQIDSLKLVLYREQFILNRSRYCTSFFFVAPPNSYKTKTEAKGRETRVFRLKYVVAYGGVLGLD